MAKKRKFAISKIEPIELVLADGKTIEAIFTIETFMLIAEKFGDLAVLAEEDINKPYDLAAKILYCGIKVMNTEIEYEEVKSIIVGGGLPLMEAIFESVVETYDGMGLDKEILKKKVEEMTLKRMK